MYGLAGYKHTSGMPDMNSKVQRLTNDMIKRNPAVVKNKSKGVSREKHDKPKYDKMNQEAARRLGVRET